MTDLRFGCKKVRNDFKLLENGHHFLCGNGVKRHWTIPAGTKKIEVRLHDGEPSANAHRFRRTGFSGIAIWPEAGETWDVTRHGTYEAFSNALREFMHESGSNEGWMEIYITG